MAIGHAHTSIDSGSSQMQTAIGQIGTKQAYTTARTAIGRALMAIGLGAMC